MNMIALKEMEELQSNESALEFRSFAVQLEEANEGSYWPTGSQGEYVIM